MSLLLGCIADHSTGGTGLGCAITNNSHPLPEDPS